MHLRRNRIFNNLVSSRAVFTAAYHKLNSLFTKIIKLKALVLIGVVLILELGLIVWKYNKNTDNNNDFRYKEEKIFAPSAR